MYLKQAGAATLVAAGLAVAGPIIKRQTSNPTPSWTTGNPGNVTIAFRDSTLNYGTVSPADVLGSLMDHCQYGTCDTEPWTMTGSVPASPAGTNEITVTITVGTASYPTWARNGLVQALQGAANSSMQSSTVTIDNNGICTSGPDCIYTPPSTITQYTFPSDIQITYQSDDSDAAPIGVISVGISVEEDSGDGWCSTFTTIGAGVASGISGWTAGVFTLLGLACMS